MRITSLRITSGDSRYYAPIERENFHFGKFIIVSCCRPFRKSSVRLLIYACSNLFQSFSFLTAWPS